MIEIPIDKVPKIRFPDFKGEWQARRLGDVGQNIIGLTYSPSDVVRDKNGIFVFRSSNLKAGGVNLNDAVFVSKTTKISEAQMICDGDILICTRNGSQHLIGKCYRLFGFSGTTFGAFMSVFRSPINDFMLMLLNTRAYKKQIQMDLGARINQITTGQLNKYVFYFPLREEQVKISDYLYLLDEKIMAQQNKVSLLIKYKKSVLRKIFELQISLDVKGNEWKRLRLDEIAKLEVSNLSANEIKGSRGLYNVYGASGLLQTHDSYQQPNPCIAIVKDGAGVGRLFWLDKKSSVLGTLNVIKPRDNVDNKYLYYCLTMINFRKYSVGSTIPHIYFKDYRNEIIPVPSLEEQQRIADFISCIDLKIESAKSKLLETKRFRRSLLRGMFV